MMYLNTNFNNATEIPTEFRDYFMNKAPGFLEGFEQQSEDHGLRCIYAEWKRNKAWLWDLFSRSQYWNGKGQIVISHDFPRNVDKREINEFFDWATDVYCLQVPSETWDYVGSLTDQSKYLKYKYFCGKYYLNDGYSKVSSFESFTCEVQEAGFNRLASEEFANVVNAYYPEVKAVAGQKCSRIIGKVCKHLGIDKADEYNKKFTRFADATNPLMIKRHTIISINPFDYWAMSNGNSWNSCHDIWKNRPRDKGNSTGYGGCYCSGTESYMLDGVSIVFYTVDASYNGNEFEFEPKVTRCMFHLGEDKIIQGRLYPQGNDVGAEDAYTETREIVQRLICEAAGATNLWKREKGCNACDYVTMSYGTHYTDYTYYENCSVSYWKGNGDELNEKYMEIGHSPLCPVCGEEHETQEYLLCDDCRAPRCTECGERIYDGDEIYIDGEPYCRDCVTWCEYHNRYEITSEHTYHSIRYYGDICEEAIEDGDFVEVEDADSLRYYDPYAPRRDVFETEDGTFYYSRTAMMEDGYDFDGKRITEMEVSA